MSNLSLVANTTSVQNNLNTIWNSIRLTIPQDTTNNGVSVSAINENVKDVMNNMVGELITNWFTNRVSNDTTIYICDPSTQWIIYLSNDDDALLYIYNPSDGKLYGLTNSNSMSDSAVDLLTNGELNEFMREFNYDTKTNGATFAGQTIGWYQLDENDKLILNGTVNNQRKCRVSTVMSNLFLVNQSA